MFRCNKLIKSFKLQKKKKKNDLPSSMKSGSVYLFADNVTIYCIKKTTDEVVAQLDKALDELYD